MVLHFLPRNCWSFLSRKVRTFFVQKRYLQRTQISVRASGRPTIHHEEHRGHEGIQNLLPKSLINLSSKRSCSSCPSWLNLRSYSFQSEQSQPSICSTFAMSSANKLYRKTLSSQFIARSYGTIFLSLLRTERRGLRPRNKKMEARVSSCFFWNSSNLMTFTWSREKSLRIRASCSP